LNTDITLIQSGGGTGPMKPGNRYSHSNTTVPIPAMETLIDERGSKVFYPLSSYERGFFID
jgi:hypothetical protein